MAPKFSDIKVKVLTPEEEAIDAPPEKLPVLFAADLPLCECCEEPWCPECQEHFADCAHPGPHSEPEE